MPAFLPKGTGGYTIIELMISIGVFLVVIIYGMTSLLSANVAHRKSQDMRSIMDNMSFIMEDISKSLRVGSRIQCFRKGIDNTISLALMGSPRSCADGWAVAFEYAEGDSGTYNDQWAYYIDSSGKLWRSTNGTADSVQLTPDEVVIDQISGFSVLGAEPLSAANSQQPFVIIRLSGKITYKGVETPFSLQTSVSQRLIDNS